MAPSKKEQQVTMTCQQLIDELVKATQRYGDLPVIVYQNEFIRFNVESAGPCSARDHFLITAGTRNRD